MHSKNKNRILPPTAVGVADLQTGDKLSLPRLDTNDYPPKSNEYMMYVKTP